MCIRDRSKGVLMFSSKSFIVSGLIFRSLIHFEFIFVYGVRECSFFVVVVVFGCIGSLLLHTGFL